MTLAEFLKWIHLLAAAVWTGGLITLAALVAALRRAGVERSVLQTVARQFGRVSWTAMAIAVITGLWQVDVRGFPWTDQTLLVKVTLVGLAIALAAGHQVTASRTSPAVRGAVQGVILLVSIAIFGVAVTL